MSHEIHESLDDSSVAVVEFDSAAKASELSTDTLPHIRLPADDEPQSQTQSQTHAQAPPARKGVARRFADRFPRGISWGVTGWMAIMHVGAVAALWYFSWTGLAIFFVLHFLTACMGITLGYHRLLTHGSLIVPAWLKYFCSLCGMLSAEGSPLMWVATHRKHHVHSDLDDDPHSPNHGFWWSHMLWFYPADTEEERDRMFRRWAPDIYKDPVQQFFHKTFPIYPVLLGIGLYAAGEYFFGLGLSWMLWGLCLRMIVSYHCTWFVNSATHVWGYRNYTTTDRSRNLWWVALLSYGEGWHNNHHAHQRLARHGHRWWEFDATYMVIRTFKFLGLAKKVQDRLPEPEQV
jgi:fatty-acid desaturase